MQNSLFHQWFSSYPWIVEVAALLGLIYAFNIILRLALNRIKNKAHLVENNWRLQIDFILLRPIQAILAIFLITSLIEIGARELSVSGKFTQISALREAGIVLCMAWLLLRWRKVFHDAVVSARHKGGRHSLDPGSLELMYKLFTILVIFVTLMLVMQILGINIVPLVTFGGIGAATLGFAGRDIFANFFGGLMLNMNRPFTLNDTIELPQKKITGTVESVGWYLTVVRSLDKKPIYIPNAFFSNELVINVSRITHRRIEEAIFLRYADMSKLQGVVAEIRSLIQATPEIDHNLPVYVYLENLSEGSSKFEIKAYTLATRYDEFMEIKQKILFDIGRIVREHGAGFSEWSWPKS